MDYSGIVFLIMGSVYPLSYYSMACEPVHGWRNFFLISITASSLLVFIMFLHPIVLKPSMRTIRVSIFTLLGLSSCAPFIYLGQIKSMDNFSNFEMMPFLIGGLFYIAGGVIMATRTPECCCPGKFDYCGASHQLMHVMVLIGCAIHFNASL